MRSVLILVALSLAQAAAVAESVDASSEASPKDAGLCLAQSRARYLAGRPGRLPHLPRANGAGQPESLLEEAARVSYQAGQPPANLPQAPTISPPAPAPQSSLSATTPSPEDISGTTFMPPEARGWSAEKEYEMEYGKPPPNSSEAQEYNDEYGAAVAKLASTTELPPAEVEYTSGVREANKTKVIPATGPVGPPPPMATPAKAQTSESQEVNYEASKDCQVGFWTEWSSCHQSRTQVLRSTWETRYRPIVNPHYLGGLPCLPRVQRRPCLTAGDKRLAGATSADQEGAAASIQYDGFGTAVAH